MTKKIIAFGASSSKNSINKQLATYAANQFQNVSIEILDLQGKQVQTLSKIQKGINTIEIENFRAGMYQVRISQNGYQTTQRLIKQ